MSTQPHPESAPAQQSCSRCGKVHARIHGPSQTVRVTCSGHKHGGDPCGQWPLKFRSVCWMHGGRRKTVVMKAEKAQLEAEAVKRFLKETWKDRPLATGIGNGGLELASVQPVQEVLYRLAEASFNASWYREVLQERFLVQRAPDENGVMWDKRDIVVGLYDAERDRAVRFAKVAHDMGIADLQIKATQELVERITNGMLAIANDAALALTAVQMEAFRHAAARELLQLTSGGQS